MNISITGHHIAITDALKDAVMEKMGKVERHFEQIQNVKVILSLDNHHSETSHAGQKNNKAEVILRLSGQEMFVSVKHDDMYMAITEMTDKLDRKVRKYRKRVERNNRSNKRQKLELLTQEVHEEVFPEAV